MQRAYKIKALGDTVPELADSFEKMASRFDLGKSFMDKLKKAGYQRPTPVQMQAVPILFEKRDAIILAETGSGKSLAFIMPLLHMLKRGDGLKAIIVVPTRELAIQLYKEFLMFANLSSKSDATARIKFLRKALIPHNAEQFAAFVKSCEVLISTPLKLADLSSQFNL